VDEAAGTLPLMHQPASAGCTPPAPTCRAC
jgi:hypothetical protein